MSSAVHPLILPEDSLWHKDAIIYQTHVKVFHDSNGDDPLNMEDMEPWRELWYKWNTIYFLRGCLETCGEAPFMPGVQEETEMLLDAYLLEKAMYELGYEINNRPDWIEIPIEGILEIMEA